MNQHVTYTSPTEQDYALWEQQYNEYYARISNYFSYQVRDEGLAQDLTAETFEQAWKSRTQFDPERGAYSTWLFAIARQKKAQFYRKKRFSFSELPTHLRDNSRPLDELADEQMNRDRLYALVETLPKKEKEIVSLRYGAGLTTKEIAEILVLSDANVRKIVSRVVKKLQKEWNGA